MNMSPDSSSVQGVGRLPHGGLIERGAALPFTFDGRVMQGCRGDTLAAALLANGVQLVGRSFKYHRRRGILTAGSEEPNALVELGAGARREPNTKATTVELFDGLAARSQNYWPSLHFDVLSLNNVLSPLLVAGFYYKTFMWPARFWEWLYEPAIRRAAGLGRAARLPDPDTYEKCHAFCDVLVVGSGPAGLIAALTAGRAGARVFLCEEDFVCGGRLLSDSTEVDGRPGFQWAAEVTAALEALPNVRVMRRTNVFGAYDGNTFGAIERSHGDASQSRDPVRLRYWKIVAKRMVLAAGATERMIAFGGNDRPGVMGSAAVRTYVQRFAVRPGTRAAIFTNNDSAWSTSRQLADAGVDVVAIVDSRVTAGGVAHAADQRVIHAGHVTDTYGRSVSRIDVRTLRGLEKLAVDLVAVSGGWNPNASLATHRGGRLRWSHEALAFVCPEPPAGVTIAGAAGGLWTLPECLASGQKAGAEAATQAGFSARHERIPTSSVDPCGADVLWRVHGSRGKAFVDFQHDVTVKDIEVAASEGYDSVEHLKRYTTLGMATDQGRTSGVLGQGILADFSRRSLQSLGTTSPRPPYAPVTIGALAARNRAQEFRPVRLTPTHQWALEQGATFTNVGLWKRAQYFPLPQDATVTDSIDREVMAVRSGAGICDVSTLGKIEVQGTDAATFLDRIYANTISTLAIGKARYGLMLREDGIVMDDGTVARLASDHYVLTTTTANADAVLQHIEHGRQVIWPQLDVQITAVTDQWAQLAVAGPRSRELLSRIVDPGFDISNARFPYLGAAEVAVCGGLSARLFRISFSGELAYEIAVPSRFGQALAERLLQAGRSFGTVMYGTEAMSVMRIEKGHVAGSEINGQTTAGDLGLGGLLATKKDYIGRVLAARAGLRDPERPTLIGLRPVERRLKLSAGAHLLRRGGETSEGFVTCAAHSPVVSGWIGLGLLARGPQRIGEQIRACDPLRGLEFLVEVCAPAFVDPENSRVRV
jgi:sarcosine oxidase subunit alpha